MPRNGSGVFTPATPEYPVVAGTLIESADVNTIIADIGTALTLSVAANGETTITANIPMAGFKITGLGNPSARTDAANLNAVMDEKGIYVGTVGGTANAITLTPSPAIAVYTAGARFTFIASASNSAAVTVNVSSVGVKNITKRGTTALVDGDILINQIVSIIYDGTRFQMVAPGDSPVADGTETISGAWTFSADLTLAEAVPTLILTESDQAVDTKSWLIRSNASVFFIGSSDDALTASSRAIEVTRSVNTIAGIVLGNTTDNPTVKMSVDGTERNVGFREIPQNAKDISYECVLTDNGKHIYKAAGGSGETITIPANASVAYPIGATLTFINQGGGTLTIAINSDTMTLAGAGTTGSRTLADDGIATAIKVATTEWLISGTGLS